PAPDARTAYRALHQAMAAGLVRACHDLSDGGLAVAVAEMCLGGRSGAAISIGDAPASGAASRAATATLFGETNGCLLAEVMPASAADFERIMAGSPLARIGSTNDSGRLELSAGGESSAIQVDDMARAFSGARSQR
ncbi:MAG: phosphoribosylformylglycinamidine synthase, partial [Spirochaetae bacterium HGW-Spirochaetae-7]